MEEEILNICSELFDRLAIVKGYLELSIERKKIDYSLLLLNEINDIEFLVRKIVDVAKKNE